MISLIVKSKHHPYQHVHTYGPYDDKHAETVARWFYSMLAQGMDVELVRRNPDEPVQLELPLFD